MGGLERAPRARRPSSLGAAERDGGVLVDDGPAGSAALEDHGPAAVEVCALLSSLLTTSLTVNFRLLLGSKKTFCTPVRYFGQVIATFLPSVAAEILELWRVLHQGWVD